MNKIQPPTQVNFEFFLVLWDSLTETFVLALPDDQTFDIGNVFVASRYLCRQLNGGLGLLGERALDTAQNFGAAQVIPSQDRCFAVRDHDEEQEARNKREHEVLFAGRRADPLAAMYDY